MAATTSIAPTQPVALQAKYAPRTATAIQRSQYLAQALRQNLDAGQQIKGGWGELGARLLAQAVLQNASGKADSAAADAIRSDENGKIAAALSGLGMDSSAFQPPPASPPASGDHPGFLGSILHGVFGGGPKPQATAATPSPEAAAATGQPITGGAQLSNSGYADAASPRILPTAPPADPPPAGAPAQAGSFMPESAPSPPQPRDPGMSVPPPAQSSAAYSPQDRDALTRMMVVEASGEGPQGMAAAGHVALNRLKSGYGGAKSLSDVVYQPHQFEGISRAGQVRPEDYAAAQQVADGILSGQIPDPTSGAMAFLNPDLQRQLGRNIPSWAQGQGQRLGNHMFFGGQPQPQSGAQFSPAQAQAEANTAMAAHQLPPGAAMGGGDPNRPPIAPQLPGGGSLAYTPPAAPTAQPYQVASNGPTPPPPQPPSAPGGLPPAQGGGAAPGGLGAGGHAPGLPAHQITDQQKALLVQYLTSADPESRAKGLAYAEQLRQKLAEETKYEFTTKDGVPIWADPYHPGQLVTAPVPEALRKHVLTGAEAERFGVPPGTVIQQAPDGGLTFERPAQGQMVVSRPGEAYREAPIPGGQNDPTRPQSPGSGYEYAGAPGQPGGPTHQQAIQGGPADPRSPSNLAQGVLSFKKDLDPIITNAMKVRQNYGAVTTGFRQQNGTGDIAMINGLQKLIDDGVVKGEDVTMQMRSNGLDGSVGGYLQYVSSGGLLTPEVRNKVFKTAGDLYHNLDQTYRARVTSMQPAVDEIYGQGAFQKYVFPQAMVDQMGWGASPSPPGGQPGAPAAATQFKPGTHDAAIAEAVKRHMGLTPQQTQRARQLGLIQ